MNLAKQGRADEAIEELMEDLTRSPGHASGWYTMATVLDKSEKDLPAFLAYSRFLTIEPQSERAKTAADRLWPLLFRRVTTNKKPGEAVVPDSGAVGVTITEPPGKSEKESADILALSIVAASRYLEEWKDKTDAEFFAHAFETAATISDELSAKDKRRSFWTPLVHDYFRQAKEKGLIEAMAYEIRRPTGDAETLKWLGGHKEAADAYRAWSKDWEPAR